MAIASAIIGGAIAGLGAVGASAIGSSAQKKATQQATQAATDASEKNIALQRDLYGNNQRILSPFFQGGYDAFNMRQALLGMPTNSRATVAAPTAANDPQSRNALYGYADTFAGDPYSPTGYAMPLDGGGFIDRVAPTAQGGGVTTALSPEQAFDNYRSSTGYEFRLGEGTRALGAGWGAQSMLRSGAADKARIKFGQDYASGEFGNFMGYLGEQQGVGLSAANALAGVGTNYATNVGNQNNALASVLANGALANGQATANMWGTAAGALGQIGGGLISSYSPPKVPAFNDNIVKRYVG